MPPDKAQWLLVKHRDEYADPMWKIEDRCFDRSVLTGRKGKEIERPDPLQCHAAESLQTNQVRG
jgi:hypothetical protein